MVIIHTSQTRMLGCRGRGIREYGKTLPSLVFLGVSHVQSFTKPPA